MLIKTSPYVKFYVEGTPRPQGSKSFIRGRIVEASKYVGKWRVEVSKEAEKAYTSTPPTDEPVHIDLSFFFRRPKSHLDSKGNVKPSFSVEHKQRPDIDKLSRAILDALTGIAYLDDSQVVNLTACKQWSTVGEGVEITVLPLSVIP